MRLRILTAVAVFGLLSTAALAENAAIPPALPANVTYEPGQPTDLQNAPNGDDTMVCNYQRETGSLLTSRVCRTLRAWKKMQADAREFFEFQHLGSHQIGEHT